MPSLDVNQATIIRDASLASQTVRFAAGLIAYCVETDLGTDKDVHNGSVFPLETDV
jgi:hypothetical protein